MRKIFYPLFCLLIFTYHSDCQVIINEYSAANMTTIFDNYNDNEDWIELYNVGSDMVDLEGYFLSDNINNPGKWMIPAGVTIDAGQHLLIFCSDRDEVTPGFIHAGFKLTQTKNEYVVLSAPDMTTLDIIQITDPNKMNHSRGRVTDGDPNWGVFINPTPGAPNAFPFAEYTSKPEFNVAPGFYSGSITVGISAAPNAQIHYTLDGSEPTPNSPLFTNPITITQTTVVKAIAYDPDPQVPLSFVEANTYFIDETHYVPVISIAGTDILDLMNGQQFDPIGSFELFGEDGTLLDEAYGDFNKHGNDSWAYDQRGIDYITRDQMGYTSSLDHKIYPTKDRNRHQRIIIKAAANDNYPFQQGGAHIRDAYIHHLSQLADLELDERSYEPAILYVNGQYWGLYEMREKVDDPDFTRHYYDQGRKWIDYIKTWGGTWEEYGSRADWDVLTDFIDNNSMADPANYQQVKEELNVQSLVDYMIINTHVVCKDWLVWNTAWWRGRNPDGEAQKWRYTLWDMDATFGHYINYTNIPNDDPSADPCDNEVIAPNNDPEGHVDLIISLLESDEFHSLYVNRYADLNNSYLSCDSMITILDRLLTRISPEMPRQIQRWGGTMQGWEDNVQELKDFILTRCEFINNGIADCYDVSGPYPVTVNVEPAGTPNRVRVNTVIPSGYPYGGEYFGGTVLNFQSLPGADWELDHWEVDTNSFAPNEFAPSITIALEEQGEVVTAFFRPAVPCAEPVDINFAVDFSTISASWDGPTNGISYEVNWRPSGSTDDWEVISTIEDNHTIFGLEVCTSYDLRIRSICENALGDYLLYTVETECVNGTEETEAGVIDMTVFPNPFEEQVTVDIILAQSSNIEVEVINATGQVVSYSEFGRLSAGQNKLPMSDLNHLSSGIYFVRVITDEGMLIERIVKR
jgi:hypothetical protein